MKNSGNTVTPTIPHESAILSLEFMKNAVQAAKRFLLL
jgi:hypothetical protein